MLPWSTESGMRALTPGSVPSVAPVEEFELFFLTDATPDAFALPLTN